MKNIASHIKSNPVVKSEEGWERFRDRTNNGRNKRPATLFASTQRTTKYQRVR